MSRVVSQLLLVLWWLVHRIGIKELWMCDSSWDDPAVDRTLKSKNWITESWRTHFQSHGDARDCFNHTSVNVVGCHEQLFLEDDQMQQHWWRIHRETGLVNLSVSFLRSLRLRTYLTPRMRMHRLLTHPTITAKQKNTQKESGLWKKMYLFETNGDYLMENTVS